MSSPIPSILQPPTAERLAPRRQWTSALRVLPDFIILGAQKAGTTSLYAYLSGHSQVAPAVAKEVHYFDYNVQRGEGWYRAHFPTLWEKWRGAFRVTGEGTPYYLFHPRAAARAAQLVPHAKLIVLLRNPVDRAYSHYQHQLRLGLETLSFEQALEAEPTRLIGEYEDLLADESYYSFNYQNYSYLARGMYAGQLARWFQFFPREQFLILPSERFYDDPGTTLAQVLEFLKLPAWQPETFRVENDGKYLPLEPALRARLNDFFAPHNAQLYDLLKTDFGWNLTQ